MVAENEEDLEDLSAVEEAKGDPARPIEELLAELGESDLIRKEKKKQVEESS